MRGMRLVLVMWKVRYIEGGMVEYFCRVWRMVGRRWERPRAEVVDLEDKSIVFVRGKYGFGSLDRFSRSASSGGDSSTGDGSISCIVIGSSSAIFGRIGRLFQLRIVIDS